MLRRQGERERVSEQAKAFAKYDQQGEDLAHRVVSGVVKASATEQAYALLWLVERKHQQIEDVARELNSASPQADQTNHHLEIARTARAAQHLAAKAAVHSAKSQERVATSARIVNSMAAIAIALSLFALWSERQKERASIQKTAADAVQMVAEVLGQL